MKLLVVGDFHGEIQNKLKKIVIQDKVDAVVSNGDYFPFHYRDLWFKHCYQTETELWEVIGKKKYRALIKKDLKMGELAIRELNSLPVPIFTVYGNVDYTRTNDSVDLPKLRRKKFWAWDNQDFFSPLLKKYKNIKRVDYRAAPFNEIVFLGAYGGSSPGKPMSKSFRNHKKKLDSLFRSTGLKYGKPIIFLSHNVPFNTLLDKIGKMAHVAVRGKHYGSKLIRRIIDQHQPLIHIGGHIHEGRGIQRIGKTLCINPGSIHEGYYALVEINGKKVRVKLKKM